MYLEIETRPWGRYYVIQDEKNYKLKKIEVEPGHRLSYQYHLHRAEVWVIIEGEALVTIDDVKTKYSKEETVIVPKMAKHRIENTGKTLLVFIEVQTGDYFGEDDIVRISDDYHRE